MDVHENFGQIADEISSADMRNIDDEDAVTRAVLEAGEPNEFEQ